MPDLSANRLKQKIYLIYINLYNLYLLIHLLYFLYSASIWHVGISNIEKQYYFFFSVISMLE